MKLNIGFIGLGKLGLACAEVIGRNHNVDGFDIEDRETRNVRQVQTIKEAVSNKDFVFIAVPTPHSSNYDGSSPISTLPPRDFDYTTLKEVLSEIAPLAENTRNIVIISTVLPGTCRRELAPLIPNVNLFYNPYFIAMGTVEWDFLNPEFVIIGTESGTENSANELIHFYKTVIGDQKFHVGTWEEGESVKIFYNTFISFKITFVNMIQDVGIRLGHMNVDKVTQALSDAKIRIISDTYLTAGMGDGGPCHPRDNIALRDLAQRLGLGYDLFSGILTCRDEQARNMAQFLLKFDKPVAILGKSYKPGVPLIEGSYSLLVAHYVKERGSFAGFIDELTNDYISENEPLTYLIAHNDTKLYEYAFFPGSIVVDPWRKCPQLSDCRVIHYGNTRPQ